RHGRLGLRGSYPCKPFARPPADFCDDIRGDGCPHPSGGAKLRSPAMFRILPSFGSAAQTWASGPTWFVPVQTVCSSSCRFLRRHTWGRVPSPVRRSEAPLPCHVPDIAELWLGRPDVGVWAYVVRTRANRLLVLLQISATTYVGTGALTRPAERSSAPLPCSGYCRALARPPRRGRLGLRGSYPCKPFARPPADFCHDIRGDGCPHPSVGAKLRYLRHVPEYCRALPRPPRRGRLGLRGSYPCKPFARPPADSATTYVGTGALTRPAERSSAISAMFPNIAELWLGAQTWASGPTWFVPVQTVCSSSCRFCLDTRGDGCPHPSGGAKLRSPTPEN